MKNMSKGSPQEKDSSIESEKKLERQRISFSGNLISCLEDIKKSFNKRNKSSIKIEQLKEVYLRGSSSSKENLNLNGLARVNMFLRMKEQKKASTTAPPDCSASQEVLELVLEDRRPEEINNFIDISDTWTPEEEDVKAAEANVKKYNLNLDFKNINELYLEPYKPILFGWE
jgi:hypothetical protein